MAPADLIRYIAHLDENGLDAHRYRVLLWQQLGLAVGLVGMGLLHRLPPALARTCCCWLRRCCFWA